MVKLQLAECVDESRGGLERFRFGMVKLQLVSSKSVPTNWTFPLWHGKVATPDNVSCSGFGTRCFRFGMVKLQHAYEIATVLALIEGFRFGMVKLQQVDKAALVTGMSSFRFGMVKLQHGVSRRCRTGLTSVSALAW